MLLGATAADLVRHHVAVIATPLSTQAGHLTIAAVFAAGFMTSVSAQDFLAEPGTPAVAFPKLDRPVANIVSPI